MNQAPHSPFRSKLIVLLAALAAAWLSPLGPSCSMAATQAFALSSTSANFADTNWTVSTTPATTGTDTVSSLDSLYFGATTTFTTLNNNDAAFTFAGLTFNSGASAFTIGGNSFTLTGAITNNSSNAEAINTPIVLGATENINATSGAITLGGAISGSTFGLNVGSGVSSNVNLGAYLVTLSGANSYTGTTTIGAGTSTASGFVSYGSGGQLQVNVASGNSDTNGALVIDAGAITIVGGNGASNSSEAYTSLQANAGSSVITVTDGGGAGTTVLNLGAITIGSDANDERAGNILFVLPGGPQSSTNGIITTTANNASTGLLQPTNSVYAQVAEQSGTYNFAAVSSGNIILNTNGVNSTSSTLAATSNDIMAANTTVAGETIYTLLFNSPAANTLTISSGTLLVGNGVGVGGAILISPTMSGSAALVTGGTIEGISGRGLYIYNENTGATTTIASTIGNNAATNAIYVSGPGTTIFSGNNTYGNTNGGTFVMGGATLQISSNANLGVNTATYTAPNESTPISLNNATLSAVVSGGSFWLDTSNSTLTNPRQIGLGSQGGTLNVNDNSGGSTGNTLTVDGVISGNGPLTKTGPNELVLSGVNTNTGGTTITTGTVQLSGAGTFGASTNILTVGANGIADLGGLSTTTGLALNGGTIQDGTLTLGVNNATSTGGTITAGIGLTTFNFNFNSGTTILSGATSASSSSGVFVVQNGATLRLLNNTTLAAAQGLTLNNGSTLQLRANSGTSYTFANLGGLNNSTTTIDVGDSNGSSTGQTLVLAPTTSNYAAGVTINVTSTNGYTLGLPTITAVGANSTLTIAPTTASATLAGFTSTSSGNNTLDLAGTDTTGNSAVTGGITNGTATAIVNKQNGSTWTLSGSSNYTGATNITGGTLIVSGSLNGTATVNIGSGATLAGIGTITTPSTGGLTGSSGSILAPGLSTNGLSLSATTAGTSAMNLKLGSTLQLSIANSHSGTPGAPALTDYSKLTLGTGVSANLAGAISTTVNGTINPGDLFTIILMTGAPATGTFSNTTTFVSGDTYSFISGGEMWLINYHYDESLGETAFGQSASAFEAITGGDDVALLAEAIPEPGTWATLVGGMGILIAFQRMRRRQA